MTPPHPVIPGILAAGGGVEWQALYCDDEFEAEAYIIGHDSQKFMGVQRRYIPVRWG